MGIKIAKAALLLAAVAGMVLVMAPAWIDRAAHWEMFVSRLPYFIPGMALLMSGAIGLAVLERK